MSPLPRVPLPPPTYESGSMDITLTLLPITPLDIQFNTPYPSIPSPPPFGHPISWNLLEAHGATCLSCIHNRRLIIGLSKELQYMCSISFKSVMYIVKVHWEKVLASKNNRGLDVSSLYATNWALLFKWIWRFLTQCSSLWSSLIKAIHGVKENIDDSQTKISGSIWQELVRELAALKSKGDSALKMMHPRLFALELKKDMTVAEKMGNDSLNLSFCHLPRSGIEDEQYKNLVSITSDVLLPQMHDHWSWSLNASVGELVVGELVVGDLVGELVVGELIVRDLMVGELMACLGQHQNHSGVETGGSASVSGDFSLVSGLARVFISFVVLAVKASGRL
ncbi:hypothetical protein Tco_1393258 [Tanacetum coccineum]